MPVSEQNRNASTSLAIPDNGDHQFADMMPDGPDEDENGGKSFTISADQLGGRGSCPHCQREIRLPRAADEVVEEVVERPEASHWWENSIAGMTSLAIHLILILILIFIFAVSPFGWVFL